MNARIKKKQAKIKAKKEELKFVQERMAELKSKMGGGKFNNPETSKLIKKYYDYVNAGKIKSQHFGESYEGKLQAADFMSTQLTPRQMENLIKEADKSAKLFEKKKRKEFEEDMLFWDNLINK